MFEIRLLVQARGWERIDGPQVTLACGPRDERTLGLIALGLGLAARRCRIDYLGAATPTTALHGDVIVVHVDGDAGAGERADLRALQAVLTGRAAAGPGAGARADRAAGRPGGGGRARRRPGDVIPDGGRRLTRPALSML